MIIKYYSPVDCKWNDARHVVLDSNVRKGKFKVIPNSMYIKFIIIISRRWLKNGKLIKIIVWWKDQKGTMLSYFLTVLIAGWIFYLKLKASITFIKMKAFIFYGSF